MNLKYNADYPPHDTFRFEDNVMLGKVEMHGAVSFGFASYMNSGFIRSYVRVGRYCSIGRNVTLGSGVHDFHAASMSPFFHKNSNPPILKFTDTLNHLRVEIGNDVWIGDNAYIMSGVIIGDGAIISAGAIVTKNVPSYTICAGVPARIIKTRFESSIIEVFLDVKFWEVRPELLKEIDISDIDFFTSKIKYIKEDKKLFIQYHIVFLNLF